MALYQFLCSVAVVILLSANGCSSDPGECGKMKKGQHPKVWAWRAVIKGAWGQECLGILISDRWVLTSLRCGHGQGHGSRVTLGRHGNQTQGNHMQGNQTYSNQTQGNHMQGNQTYSNQTQGNQNSNEQYSMVEKVKCRNHVPYGKKMSGLCLLKLAKPVHFTDSIHPVCLASKYSILSSKMMTYVLSGALYPSVMKVPLVGQRKCKCFYPGLSEGMICAERWRPFGLGHGGRMDGYRMDGDMMDGDRMDGYRMDGDRMDGDMMDGDRMDGDMMYKDMMDKEMMDDCQPGVRALMSLQGDAWTLVGLYSDSCEASEGPQFFTSLPMNQEWIAYVTGRDSFKTIYSGEFDPDSLFECPRKCPYPHEDCDDDSFFSGAAIMTPFSPFVLLCVLALSLFFTRW